MSLNNIEKYFGRDVDVYIEAKNKMIWCGMQTFNEQCCVYSNKFYVVKKLGDLLYGFTYTTKTDLNSVCVDKNKPKEFQLWIGE
jgi:hypothetical protein